MSNRQIVLLGTLFASSALCAGAAAPLAAQAWDTPAFFSPRPGEDIGLYIIDADGVSDLGFAGIWRQEGNINLGVRAGIAGGDYYTIGAEFYGPLNVLGPQSPLLVSWVLGAGATFNGVTWLRIPLGASIGLDLGSTNSLRILPYVHPRVAFDLVAFDTADGEETDTEFTFDLDLGADIGIGQQFVLRFGATIGDRSAIGAGIAYKMGRRLVVR
ncbi:MAG: hypothetical protein KFH98_16450 [Gemmatimonadetes bacterium]|nr:hypothetical protein [Gemmatimonadota bacterium]